MPLVPRLVRNPRTHIIMRVYCVIVIGCLKASAARVAGARRRVTSYRSIETLRQSAIIFIFVPLLYINAVYILY